MEKPLSKKIFDPPPHPFSPPIFRYHSHYSIFLPPPSTDSIDPLTQIRGHRSSVRRTRTSERLLPSHVEHSKRVSVTGERDHRPLEEILPGGQTKPREGFPYR